MKTWTIYRYQAGDPRERWLRVGQLGTETEQNAIAAARAIWGDGSENHWLYGAEKPPRESITLDGNSWCERLETRLDVLARHVAEIERQTLESSQHAAEIQDTESRETIEEIKRLDAAIASLENRDEARERDAKGLAESIMDARGRAIAADEANTQTVKLLGQVRREVEKKSKAEVNRFWASRAEADRRLRELEAAAARVDNLQAESLWAQEQIGELYKLAGRHPESKTPPYDPSRSPTRSVSPPEVQATGGASAAFSPKFQTIDARPKSWNVFGHLRHPEATTLIGTVTARSKASAFREAETIFRAEVKKFAGWSVEPVEILLPEGETKDTAERIVEATNPAHYWEVLGRTAGTAGFLCGVTEAKTYDEAMDNARGEAGDLWHFFNVRRLHPDEVEALRMTKPDLFETWGYPPNVNRPEKPPKPATVFRAESEPSGGPLTGFDSQGHG